MEVNKTPGQTGTGIKINLDDNKVVQFGGHTVALAGLFAGAAIAVCVPAVLVIFRGELSEATVIILSILALIIGGGVAAIAAFFGSVIPTFVKSNGGKKKRKKNHDEPQDELETQEESDVSE